MTDDKAWLDELERFCDHAHYQHQRTGTILDLNMPRLIRLARRGIAAEALAEAAGDALFKGRVARDDAMDSLFYAVSAQRFGKTEATRRMVKMREALTAYEEATKEES